ncbi:agamous-like MADS-box protein AGL29 [Solanum stenotomum]|uniref:agamous-like MADS-box protein AGL29 n=1 Tax=Solanum stenotomum TaxID=172797 RepID=UPI0020D0D6BE|nr:agamous-like MADS-box protein AGL29 [Solanum stenotomum]
MDKKTGKGRQKIEMKLIESKEAHDIGILLFSPSGKPYSYGSTSIDEITDKFFYLKLDDRQGEGDHADVGKSNVFEAFEELRKEIQALDKKQKEHPHSDILLHKYMLEEYMAIKLRLDNIKKDRKGKSVHEPEKEESS